MNLLALTALASIALQGNQRIPLDCEWEIAAEVAPSDPPEWRPINLPAPSETVLGLGFDGVARVRRTLPLDATARGARVAIEFAAVATQAEVFCNGVKVADHLGGWTPFRAELTDALRFDGHNTLEVRIDEKLGHNTQGFLPIIQPHFGGLWQSATLCVERGPTIDRLGLFTFGQLASDGTNKLEVRGRVLSAPDQSGATRIRVTLFDGDHVRAASPVPIAADGTFHATMNAPGIAPWRPGDPHLTPVRVILLDATGAIVDEVERNVGFRSVRADGTKVLWNGAPFQMRGLLHWGYSPPFLAPPRRPEFWRPQLEALRDSGFNTLKCCLWIPPECVLDLCDELGIAVWQEYPTWHPQMDAAHRAELRAEFEEFFRKDASHPCVAFRSLTCETGPSAELAVIQELFDACHAAVPETLVVDDSSWIGWQRVTDFWDEHPYGNNRWWPGRLEEFRQFGKEHGEKPLLLGECIAADTWADRGAWLAEHGEPKSTAGDSSHDAIAEWWRPDCFDAQTKFERELAAEFGEPLVASLGPISRETAMRTRKFQIERLRATLPDAGFVVSVARDFAKARMGLMDDLGRPKWSAADWSWQGDVMLSLLTEKDARAFVGPIRAPVVVSASASHPISKLSALWLELLDGESIVPTPASYELTIPSSVSAPFVIESTAKAAGPAATPKRLKLVATLQPNVDAEPIRNEWDLWQLPPHAEPPPEAVRVADHLDLALLDFLENGGRALLRVDGTKGTLKSSDLWWLRGAPFAPPHPLTTSSDAAVPAELLLQLQPFDLDGGRVMPWTRLWGEVDPILAFWETHDIAEVRRHLFAFDCRVGKGRLLASTFDPKTPAGAWLEEEFRRWLATGAEPKRGFSPKTLAELRATLDPVAAQRIELPQWRFRLDPKDAGLAAGWAKPATDVTSWGAIAAGSHWENQEDGLGDDLKSYTGVAWYRVDVDVPATWNGIDARAVFEGIDDSAIVWLDGVEVGRFGDPVTKTTVWLERSVAELGRKLTPGRHALVLRVVDHAGAGGLWKPAFLTTGPASTSEPLLE